MKDECGRGWRPWVLRLRGLSFQSQEPATRIEYVVGHCELGAFAVAVSHRGVCALLFDDTTSGVIERLHDAFPLAGPSLDPAARMDAARAMHRLVERPDAACDDPVDVRGRAFQRRIWRLIQAIPAGETRTVQQLARMAETPMAVRAVRAACLANRLAIIVPCHRVLGHGEPACRLGEARQNALLRRERKLHAG